jgi:cholesterol transport system auxiliary component
VTLRNAVLFMLAVVLASGCGGLSKPTPPKQGFLLGVERPEAAASGPAIDATLKVLPFAVTAPYNLKSMVYREDDVRYDADYYNEWFAAPGAMLTDRTATWLAQSKVFNRVIPPGSGVEGSLELEGIVSELFGDFRAGSAPQAVVAIRFHVSDSASGALRYDRLLREASPVASRSPEALARGMDAAMARLLARLEDDLRGLKLAGK